MLAASFLDGLRVASAVSDGNCGTSSRDGSVHDRPAPLKGSVGSNPSDWSASRREELELHVQDTVPSGETWRLTHPRVWRASAQC